MFNFSLSFSELKSDLFLNSCRVGRVCDFIRHSFQGRLIIICTLIIGLILLMWGIILGIGLYSLAHGLPVAAWIVSTTVLTQNICLTTGSSIIGMVAVLLTLGSIVCLSMSILLPLSTKRKPDILL